MLNNKLSLEKTMTVKEIAESLNVPIRTLHDSIDRVLPGIKQNGKTTYLTESQAVLISIDLKKAHNIDLASTRKVAITEQEEDRTIINAMQILVRRNEDYKNLIDELKPKADLAEIALRDTNKHYSIRDAGKILGLSQSEIFALLRSYGLLTTKDIPSQKSLSYKILTLRTNIVGNKTFPQSVMTMENIDNFRLRYLTKIAIEEDK